MPTAPQTRQHFGDYRVLIAVDAGGFLEPLQEGFVEALARGDPVCGRAAEQVEPGALHPPEVFLDGKGAVVDVLPHHVLVGEVEGFFYNAVEQPRFGE